MPKRGDGTPATRACGVFAVRQSLEVAHVVDLPPDGPKIASFTVGLRRRLPMHAAGETTQWIETARRSIAHWLIYPVDPGLCVHRICVTTEALLYRYIRSVLSTFGETAAAADFLLRRGADFGAERPGVW